MIPTIRRPPIRSNRSARRSYDVKMGPSRRTFICAAGQINHKVIPLPVAVAMLRYTPPKSRLHGHGCSRLSASDLLAKANQFLAEHTCLDDRHGDRSLTVTWRSSGSDRVANILHQLFSDIGDPAET